MNTKITIKKTDISFLFRKLLPDFKVLRWSDSGLIVEGDITRFGLNESNSSIKTGNLQQNKVKIYKLKNNDQLIEFDILEDGQFKSLIIQGIKGLKRK